MQRLLKLILTGQASVFREVAVFPITMSADLQRLVSGEQRTVGSSLAKEALNVRYHDIGSSAIDP